MLLVDAKRALLLSQTRPRAPSCTPSRIRQPASERGPAGRPSRVLLYGGDEELGAGVMMYNNKVFQIGGTKNATAIYDVALNSWSLGPVPDANLSQSDGPSRA